MPYIIGAIGFLATFSAKVSRALMSTSSHVPSGAIARADGVHHLLGMGHVVDAVERRDEVERVVVRQRLVARVVEVGVGEAGCSARRSSAARRARAARCRSRGPVAFGKASAMRQHRHPGTAADVGRRAPPASRAWHDAVERRQRDGHEEVPVPRLEGALDAGRALGPVGVVVVPDARCGSCRAARSSSAISSGSRPNMPMPKAGWLGSASTASPRASGRRWRRRRRCARAWRPPGCAATPASSARRGRVRSASSCEVSGAPASAIAR